MLQRLAELRKNKNWSLQETADRLGIAKSTYAGYESGYREPSLKALSQIADLFETSVDYILNRLDYKNTNLELIELLGAREIVLSLDEITLSTEELRDFIAFTRLKRNVKSQLD
ncbi:helix-turn-helix domain-containing protein [Bacillus sp. 1NLA3E]|uniref:helix-turn-helix domain-containing protein n=1 Tax=Bacillus sp. 1NLA3E TaxID=666686 RepID=UPI000247EBB7|nr:helix-turn-helix transcriptional regulator [Bacillus sp. 1NLA3E]AGK53431.1 ans operon repressor protein [Bacillus sp. 1NLA3E]